MGLWVEACNAELAPDPTCTGTLEYVDVSAAVPFQLTEAHLTNMGQAFSAGLFIVVAFWGLGYGASLVLRAIKS